MENTTNKNTEEVIEIDLLEIFWLLMGKLWILLLVAIIFGIGGYVYSSSTTVTKYMSTTSVYVRSDDTSDTTYSDTQLASVLANDYVTLITGRYVLETAIDEYSLGLTYEELYNMVEVSNETSTRIIEIYVTNEDPYLAQKYANAIRSVAAEYIKDVTGAGAVITVDEANLPTTPVTNGIRKITIIAALIGFVIAAGIIVLIHLMDDTIKTSDDVERYLGLSTLASIPLAEPSDVVVSKKPQKKKSSSGSIKVTNLSS